MKRLLILAGAVVSMAFMGTAYAENQLNPSLSITTGGAGYQLAATDPAKPDAKKADEAKKKAAAPAKKVVMKRKAPAKKVVAKKAAPPAAPAPKPAAAAPMTKITGADRLLYKVFFCTLTGGSAPPMGCSRL